MKERKNERITILADQKFKAYLAKEAENEGVSVGELVRRRCEHQASGDEIVLASLSAELRSVVADAKITLRSGLEEATAILSELADRRGNFDAPTLPRRAGGKR